MSFADIVGHQGAIRLLKRAVLSRRVPHAYLFVGPSNVGKTLVATELAKALNCEEVTAPQSVDDIEPCDRCSACTRIQKGTHPDFRLVYPTAHLKAEEIDELVAMAGAEIRIEQIRDLIESVALKVNQARRRVYIITEAEAMNQHAENAFLKTLEEPAGATTIILTTSSPASLLPTIVSRCQVVNFHPVPADEACTYLSSRHPEADSADIHSIVAMSAGRLGWAQRLLQQPEVLQIRSDLLDLCARLPGADWVECFQAGEAIMDLAERWWLATTDEEIAERALKASRDRVLRTSMYNILDILAMWFRDLLLLSSSPQADGLLNVDRGEQLRGLAGRYDVAKCEAASRHLQDMRGELGQNANIRLAAETLALRLIVT